MISSFEDAENDDFQVEPQAGLGPATFSLRMK